MEVPSSKARLKDLINSLPKSPGVYKFLDISKRPIYIGKAKDLRNRVSSYFRESSGSTNKTEKLVANLKSIEIILTSNELEALLMEQYLIKEEKPKFNVQFKDDKGYPWIKIETSKEFPAAKSYLGRKDNIDSFFGPFPSSYAVRDSLKLLQKTFKIRSCSDSFFKNRTRPCIQYEIGRCSAPCVGLITKKEYMNDVKSTSLLLSGKSENLISSFYSQMDKHSKNKSFEKAALYRDKISSLRDIQRKQSIAGYTKERDAIAVFSVNGQTKVGITHVNEGWVTGHENFIQKNSLLEGSVLESFIQTYYLDGTYCPSNLVIAEPIKSKKIFEKALSLYHNKRITIITKLSKRDQGLLKICQDNTKYSLKGNLKTKSALLALEALRLEFSFPKRIRTIESYDISHHSGSEAVAGCVVFSENGKIKDNYRLFNISKQNAGNDIASMVEVIGRRFMKDSDLEIPDLILLDGGKIHLSNVSKKLKELGVEGVYVIAISKGARRKAEMDLVHTTDGKKRKVSKGSKADKFIQEIRDETHRFSLSIQKKKIRKTSKHSFLDTLKGVGPKRKKKLIRYFGSLEQIRQASSEDLANVPGLGRKTANLIYNQIK